MKLQQRLLPQQILLMRLLQIPSEDLENTIKEEIEKNPLLEDDSHENGQTENDETRENDNDSDFDASFEEIYDDYDDYYLTRQPQHRSDDYDDSYRESNISSGTSFHALLQEQLSVKPLTERQQFIGNELIGYIDESGYMTRDLGSLVDDFAFNRNFETTEEEVGQVLKIIQSLEPAGVAARNLQECLSLQLRHMPGTEKAVKDAVNVIDRHFDSFAKKHYEKICKSLNLSKKELSNAIEVIISLNPKPGMGFAESEHEMTLVPDFIVSRDGDELSFSLNGKNVPSLHLSKYYMDILRDISQSQKISREQRETMNFIKANADSANAFIEAIQLRYNTLESTMAAILNYQKDYFMSGNINLLRPMLLKDIATITGFDISTVSRVVTKKYVQAPFGTFLLKELFSNAMSSDDGEDVATITIKQILKDVVEKEDKTSPLTDDELRILLQEKGFNIARRTVAKYRESMDIPVGRLRKKLKNND